MHVRGDSIASCVMGRVGATHFYEPILRCLALFLLIFFLIVLFYLHWIWDRVVKKK